MNWAPITHLISQAKRIVLTTHENPDGDGLGSAVAMYYYLKSLKKVCRIILCSPLPAEYSFLNKKNIFSLYSKVKDENWFKKCDLAIIFDVGSFHRIRAVKDELQKNQIKTLNIDHHPYPLAHPFTINAVDTCVAATGVLIYDYFTEVKKIKLSKSMLEGIYTAVMTDTGSFRYSNTDAQCHEIAIAAMKAGVNTSVIYQQVYESKPVRSIKLLAKVIDHLHFENHGRLAWFTIDQNMLKYSGATHADVDGYTDFVRTIKGVEVAVMIFDKGNGICRVNFRSKGKFIINGIAKQFGGGGHKYAAGVVISETKKSVVSKVIAETKKAMNKQYK